VRRLVEARRATARNEVLRAARECLLSDGPAFSIAAVAERLGMTKPAVYYYFPSRGALVRELAVAAVARESETLARAIDASESASSAVASLLETCVRHHLENFDDFRLIYALLPLLPDEVLEGEMDAVRQSIYPKGDRVYGALEARLIDAQQRGELAKDIHPRRLSVALHLAALGFASMYGVTNARGDPLKHTFDDLVSELVEVVTRGLVKPAPARTRQAAAR